MSNQKAHTSPLYTRTESALDQAIYSLVHHSILMTREEKEKRGELISSEAYAMTREALAVARASVEAARKRGNDFTSQLDYTSDETRDTIGDIETSLVAFNTEALMGGSLKQCLAAADAVKDGGEECMSRLTIEWLALLNKTLEEAGL